MKKYQILECLGNGSYGIVNKALNLENNDIVAIKTLKQSYQNLEECMQSREVKTIIKMKHKNIIKLLQMHFESKQLNLVFEYAPLNLYQLYKQRTLNEENIKQIILQIAEALSYMHNQGLFHRDLKPENILVDGWDVKIIDFGLSKEINSQEYTEYVATRWYRAPEILLHCPKYGAAVDIFALGCIMCELYLGQPLFLGQTEIDQLDQIFKVLGTFSQKEWPQGYDLMQKYNFHVLKPTGINIKNASKEAIDLIIRMLEINPDKRIKAADILEHKLFQQGTPVFGQKVNKQLKQMTLSQK